MPPTTVFGDRHVVTARSASQEVRKLFAVGFRPDGTVFVHLPYFAESEGFLARAEGRLLDGEARITNVGSKYMTSHRVKFSYHPNGRAHFSQDRQVKTVVIDGLPPLSRHTGVLFHVDCHGLTRYKELVASDCRSRKRSIVDCTPGGSALGVAVTGFISKPDLPIPVESVGEPRCVAESPQSGYLIALAYQHTRVPTGYTGSHLLFLGGPSDPAIIARGASRSLLLAAYPRGAATQLFPEASSADYAP
jgi:hypothetical protein